MTDIKNTLEVIDFGMAIAQGVFGALKDDGKITIGDLPQLMPALVAMPAAIEGIDQLPAELKDLDEKEVTLIRDHVLAKLPDVGEKWGVVAKEAITIAMSAFKIYTVLKS